MKSKVLLFLGFTVGLIWFFFTWVGVVVVVGMVVGLIGALRIGIVLGSLGVTPIDGSDYVLPVGEEGHVNVELDEERRLVSLQWHRDALGDELELGEATLTEKPMPVDTLGRGWLRSVWKVDDPVFDPYVGTVRLAAGPPHTLIIAERIIPLTCARNFRDLGGYRTRDGGQVRFRKVFRTDHLRTMSDADRRRLGALGIQTVCDLRTLSERERTPTPEIEGARHFHLPIIKDPTTSQKLMLYGATLFARRYLYNIFEQMYVMFLEEGAEGFRALFSLFADPRALPVTFFCSAGKDRTGLASMLLLLFLGVDEEVVLADYCLTNRTFDELFHYFTENHSIRSFGVPDKDAKVMFTAHPGWMRSVFRHLQDKFGGAEGYLHRKVGLSRETLDNIRENLLVSSFDDSMT